MKNLAIAVLTFAAATAAQSVASPSPHYGTWEGDLWNAHPFSVDARLQQIHSDLGASAFAITKLTLRREGSLNGVPQAGVAKTGTLVLKMAPSVASAAATNSFTANYAGTATTVFSGTFSLPPAWATPATQSPTPFDFPIVFTTPYVHLGTSSSLWDAQVSGLSNTDRVYLDHASSGFSLFANCAYDMYGTGCTTPTGTMSARGTGQNLGGLGSFNFGIRSTGAPANAPGVLLIGAGAIALTVPGLCSKLYVNPLATVPSAANSDAAGVLDTYVMVSGSAALIGVPVNLQAAAIDPTQVGIQVAVSNGVTFRTAPMAPSFAVSQVRQAASSTTTPTLVATQATVVQFN